MAMRTLRATGKGRQPVALSMLQGLVVGRVWENKASPQEKRDVESRLVNSSCLGSRAKYLSPKVLLAFVV